MLKPWVSLIALGLSLLLLWQLGMASLAWLGGALLATALLAPLFSGGLKRWRRQESLKKAEKLDWSIIDNSLQRVRPQRDCERPETLGQCSGRDCFVYDSCNFNIKKVLP